MSGLLVNTPLLILQIGVGVEHTTGPGVSIDGLEHSR
jgi:hypothetical protein